MIKDFKHKGLKQFFLYGSVAGINIEHSNKIRLRLAVIDSAAQVNDINRPGYNLHQLKGNKLGYWSIVVTGNWRITFRFENGNAYIVNYEDYH
ncbi:MAG TPA: Killer protein [Providencia sp.]|uniref:type II toxin-antitoxin system RelE/ParE family toxin n=1 Tax=Providencia sp. TaxID=589 RepID=UPI000E95C439|nr:type II toxin-antitoxin system RelE/ParE family toxin [Providencia sp.]MBP6081005.1 type II toxin-antitoxin system RelE/ParE family toxin [Providencia sp.]HBO24287.1 Killer protein [Providencia sp.]